MIDACPRCSEPRLLLADESRGGRVNEAPSSSRCGGSCHEATTKRVDSTQVLIADGGHIRPQTATSAVARAKAVDGLLPRAAALKTDNQDARSVPMRACCVSTRRGDGRAPVASLVSIAAKMRLEECDGDDDVDRNDNAIRRVVSQVVQLRDDARAVSFDALPIVAAHVREQLQQGAQDDCG